MSESSELRRAERKAVDVLVPVEDAISGQVLGHIGNLSRTGLLLICRQVLQDDAFYQIRFNLPGKGKITSFSLEVGVHEQWTQPSADAGQSWSGVRIVDIAPKTETLLLEWLA